MNTSIGIFNCHVWWPGGMWFYPLHDFWNRIDKSSCWTTCRSSCCHLCSEKRDVSIISIQEFMNCWYIYIFVTSQFSRCISWLSQFYKSNAFPCFPMFSWWNRCGEKCFQQLRCATMKARSPPSSGGRCFLFFDEMTSLFDDCPLVNRWIVVNSG